MIFVPEYQVREQPKFRFYASVEVGLKVRVLVFQNVFQIHPLSISSDFTMFFLILSFIFRDFQKKVFLRQKQSQKQRFWFALEPHILLRNHVFLQNIDK